MRIARDLLAERARAKSKSAPSLLLMYNIAEEACAKLSNNQRIGDVRQAVLNRTPFPTTPPEQFPTIPESVIRAKQPNRKQIEYSTHLLNIIATFFVGIPVQDSRFTDLYVAGVLASTPGVPCQRGLAELHNRDGDFENAISQISSLTGFEYNWVKF